MKLFKNSLKAKFTKKSSKSIDIGKKPNGDTPTKTYSKNIMSGDTEKSSSTEPLAVPVRRKEPKSFQKLLQQNSEWAKRMVEQNPDYFKKCSTGQWPTYLWLGCADSRVAANIITRTEPGDMFVHRNVGNVVSHGDTNCMSCLAYSVGALKVKHVVVCGHYGCGAVKAALTLPSNTDGVVSLWISQIREVRNKWARELEHLTDEIKWKRLCELNAIEQALHAATSQPVQAAWKSGQELYVSCVIYDVADGSLKTLMKPISSINDLLNIEEYSQGNLVDQESDEEMSVTQTNIPGWVDSFRSEVSTIMQYEA